jgi:hypothetical protein
MFIPSCTKMRHYPYFSFHHDPEHVLCPFKMPSSAEIGLKVRRTTLFIFTPFKDNILWVIKKIRKRLATGVHGLLVLLLVQRTGL